MFLKRIEIYGFKSFAQKSVIDFDYTENGNITAVVGPNGSGKSNVADAIRWVTGEQSSKNLRSKKSEDVIFCGSSSKPRGSYAEVSIILADKKPFKFDLNNKEYSMTEIEVSRKLFRSGESEYLINGKKVRLADISQLMASLGFGQSSYTVIGQGMVDRLLFFTASERKVLFDEAAGVKQYELKREQAVRKLESTDANLIRLSDILLELSPRVANLRRLVKRAEGRKEAEKELEDARVKYYGSLAYELGQGKDELLKKKEVVLEKISSVDKEMSLIIAARNEVSENPYRKKRAQIEEEISRLSILRDGLLREVSYLRGQIESANHNGLLLENKKADLEKERVSLKEKITFLISKIESGENELKPVVSKMEIMAKDISSLDGEISKIDDLISAGTGIDTKKIDELNEKIKELASKKSLQEANFQKRLELEGLLAENQSELNKFLALDSNEKKNIATLESEIKVAEKQVNILSSDLNKYETEIASLVGAASLENIEKLDGAINNAEKEHSKLVEAVQSGGEISDKLKLFSSILYKLFIHFRSVSKAIKGSEKEKLEIETVKVRKDLEAARQELNRLQIIYSRKKAENEGLVSKISEKNEMLSNLKAELKKFPSQAADNYDEELLKLREELKYEEGAVSEKQNVLLIKKDKIQTEIYNKKEELHQLVLEKNRLSIILENQSSELKGSETRSNEVEKEYNSLLGAGQGNISNTEKDSLLAKERELDKLEEDLAKQRGGLVQLASEEKEFERKGLETERESRSLAEQKNVLLSQLSEAEIELAKLSVKTEDLLVEVTDLGITDLGKGSFDILDQMEKDVLKSKMDNLRRKLEQTISVDPETEAEFKDLEIRETEMSSQVSDLRKAKEDLEKVVVELDSRIKNQFSKVFTEISSEFSRYFSMLFGGGSSALSLGKDEEGSFGIEITANPPGKKVQSLSALSGGERTLTSLALLFAILSVNPSPFCVLDEVDAALDESNTLRFVKILSDLAKKTQFIIISHNRDTMKMADSLYGVTMNDEHVSKLLSVKLTEALASGKA